MRSNDTKTDRMFLKLRLKISVISIALIMIILSVIFMAIGSVEYNEKMNYMSQNLDQAIMKVATNTSELSALADDENLIVTKTIDGVNDLNQYIPIAVYKIDNNDLIPLTNTTLDPLIMNKSKSTFIHAHLGMQQISDTGLVIYKKALPDCEMVAFTDMSYLIDYIDSYMRTFMLVVVLIGIFLGIAVWLLSKWLVRPLKNAWDKQKRFIADASHELKTPISVIVANSHIILSGNTNEDETKNWTQITLDEAEKMSELINDMLYMSTTSLEAKPKEIVSFGKEAMKTVMQFEAKAFETGNRIVYDDIEMEGTNISVDAKGLHRVIAILIDNACKYSYDDTDIIVSVSAKKKNVELSIKDEGEKIPKECEHAVFDRFFRMDESRTGRNGYGLGLSMAKDIVLANNGEIAASTEGTLTVFTVSFPKA